MRYLILLLICGFANAQTLTVSDTTYRIVSGDLLTIANSYMRGAESCGIPTNQVPTTHANIRRNPNHGYHNIQVVNLENGSLYDGIYPWEDRTGSRFNSSSPDEFIQIPNGRYVGVRAPGRGLIVTNGSDIGYSTQGGDFFQYASYGTSITYGFLDTFYESTPQPETPGNRILRTARDENSLTTLQIDDFLFMDFGVVHQAAPTRSVDVSRIGYYRVVRVIDSNTWEVSVSYEGDQVSSGEACCTSLFYAR